MISGSNNTPNIRNTAYTEQAVPARPATPAAGHSVEPAESDVSASQSPPPAKEESGASKDEVRKLGVSDASPVQVSFQAPAATVSPIQGVRRLSPSEELLALPDLPSSEDLQEAVDYYQSALSAVKEGALDIAQDFLTWARELDPGAPDLPLQ